MARVLTTIWLAANTEAVLFDDRTVTIIQGEEMVGGIPVSDIFELLEKITDFYIEREN